MKEQPLTLVDVSKRFRSVTALRSVSWSPRRGQVTALVGMNGAGKSTLMRVMAGLIRPTDGSVTRTGSSEGRPLSAMIEAPALFKGLSVRRNLGIHRVLTGAGRSTVEQVGDLAQVRHVFPRRVAALSQGYRQRVAVAVALMGSPAMLLLDEPTNALDPEAITHVRALIRRVADSGIAVVVSTHMLRELEGVADALTVLHEGRIVYDGTFADFVGTPHLRVRVEESAAAHRLAGLLAAADISVEEQADGLRVPPGGQAIDDRARQVFGIAADAGIGLVELGHLAPTLEEAFHTAIAGVRS